jgi:hypothetical protein
MRVSDFDYELPQELIAQKPVEPRDASRLLTLDRRSGKIGHRVFRDLSELLRPGDCLVANNSRVMPARLLGHKTTGGVPFSTVYRSCTKAASKPVHRLLILLITRLSEITSKVDPGRATIAERCIDDNSRPRNGLDLNSSSNACRRR